jgi:hypothetical protein
MPDYNDIPPHRHCLDCGDTEALAKTVYTSALLDVFNGKGRIILSDFRRETKQPDLTAEQIIAAWQKTYPEYPIDQRTNNTLIIEFGRQRK